MNIAILTNFQDFNPGYSLTGIVHDQVTMLTRYGHTVHLFTCEQYNPQYDIPLPEGVTVHHAVPFGHLKDYNTLTALEEPGKVLAKKTEEFLVTHLTLNKIDIVFTHDWIFTGWNLPYSIGIRLASKQVPDVRWLHWIHSVPSVLYDWWTIRSYGPKHKIIFPNEVDRLRVAEQFRGEVEDVRVIPHIKDLRTWYDFDEETCRFINDYPAVMQADFVQIYPASTDRLTAKRVDIVAQIFGQLKGRGFKVCLVVANQWATGRQRKEDVENFYKFANKCGLKRDVDFIFTSEWDEKYATGIPRVMLRELTLCSNLFIFPTREESFGLVGPEAAHAGAFLVLNKNLEMMKDVFGGNGMYADFGSFTHDQKYENALKYYYDIGSIIIGRCWQSEAFRTKTWCRQMLNSDYLYIYKYEPVMEESKLWK